MNIKEINQDSYAKLYQYVAAAISFTAITVWIIVAFQIQIKEPEEPCSADGAVADERSQYTCFAFGGGGGGTNDGRRFKHLNLWDRLTWPIVLISTMIERRKKLKEMRAQRVDTIKLAQFCN